MKPHVSGRGRGWETHTFNEVSEDRPKCSTQLALTKFGSNFHVTCREGISQSAVPSVPLQPPPPMPDPHLNRNSINATYFLSAWLKEIEVCAKSCPTLRQHIAGATSASYSLRCPLFRGRRLRETGRIEDLSSTDFYFIVLLSGCNEHVVCGYNNILFFLSLILSLKLKYQIMISTALQCDDR